MAREIENCSLQMAEVSTDQIENIDKWLADNAPNSADTLLAFALDGLIWGKLKEGKLIIAHDYTVELRADTLQEARVFGESGELHVWRVGDGFQACQFVDSRGDSHQYFDEAQMLWGDHAEKIGESGFALMSDGVQGLHHAVPLPLDGAYDQRPLRLVIRHYLATNEPFARIAHSRLVKLEATHGTA